MARLKYFFPDSLDVVDPSFDFLSETRNEHRVRQRDELYPHEIFKHPYDGMLVSKAVVDGLGSGESRYTRSQRLRFYRQGMRDFFRLPQNMISMGDCGAFTYVSHEEPPYTVDEVIEFYSNSGFDYAVSMDHIVFGYEKNNVPLDDEFLTECKRRQELTLTLANDFLKKSNGEKFQPFGVAHGWNKTSYKNSVKQLLDMGYSKITMGGMVPLKTNQILETLQEINPIRKSDTQIHLLGIARPESFNDFVKFGVTSIDSTTPLQQAFKDRKKNYHTVDGKDYVALRVPQLDANLTLNRKIKSGTVDPDKARELERKALSALRAYGCHQLGLEPTLNALMMYEELHAGNVKAETVRQDYLQTLSDRPWESCQCEVCQQIGINVIIFRGAERNRRRGFHNIQVLYRRLQNAFGEFA